MPDDPENQADKTEEKTEEQESQKETKEEQEQEQEVNSISLPCLDEQVRNYSPKEILRLAQLGEHSLRQKPKEEEKEEKEEKEITLEEKYENLNRELQEYKEGTKREKELHQFKVDLNEAIDSFDLFKDYPQLKAMAQIASATLMSQNVNLTHKQAVAKFVKEQQDFMKSVAEKEKKSRSANKKVFARVTQGQKGGGGLPEMESSKPLTIEAMNTGKSRRALEDYLRSVAGDE